MNLQKIPLNTVRQFFIQDIVLSDHQDLFTAEAPRVTKKVEDFCHAKVKHGTQPYTTQPPHTTHTPIQYSVLLQNEPEYIKKYFPG